jgi:hypothetical protein
LQLADIAQDGRVILTQEIARRSVMISVPSHKAERDLALLDWSLLRDLSADGKYALLTEEGEGGGPNYSVYLRNIDDGSAIRLGGGDGWALSPDGKWVLARSLAPPRSVFLLPTGAGEPRPLNTGGVEFEYGLFTPDGNRIVFAGIGEGGLRRAYVMDINGSQPRSITQAIQGAKQMKVTPDGGSVLSYDDGKWWLYPINGGERIIAKGLNPDDDIAGWSPDPDVVYAGPQTGFPGKVYSVRLSTGRREFCCQFSPNDITGVGLGFGPLILSPKKDMYAYSFTRRISNLYLMDAPK